MKKWKDLTEEEKRTIKDVGLIFLGGAGAVAGIWLADKFGESITKHRYPRSWSHITGDNNGKITVFLGKAPKDPNSTKRYTDFAFSFNSLSDAREWFEAGIGVIKEFEKDLEETNVDD